MFMLIYKNARVGNLSAARSSFDNQFPYFPQGRKERDDLSQEAVRPRRHHQRLRFRRRHWQRPRRLGHRLSAVLLDRRHVRHRPRRLPRQRHARAHVLPHGRPLERAARHQVGQLHDGRRHAERLRRQPAVAEPLVELHGPLVSFGITSGPQHPSGCFFIIFG
jgi:hypothetical protein